MTRDDDNPTPNAQGAKPGRKAPPDWERIEFDYRVGLKTLRQIADENGISHGAINKRAKRDGWERDLSAKIQSKADALVSKAEVSSRVSTETRPVVNGYQPMVTSMVTGKTDSQATP